ncbi:hypothetical protein Tco_1041286 [Tanacetum coccineum]|uniref:Uncharacterized protein n=1 Tax=Tanacetum coccineum TaxID=301880 RepID=A0ABQ5GH63_9ASTR
MGTMRDTLTEGGEGALHLGPERARVFADLSAEQKGHQYKATLGSRDAELWFKMSVEDTMRIIKEDHFRETMQEEMLLLQGTDAIMQALENDACTGDLIYDEDRDHTDSNTPFDVQDHDTFVKSYGISIIEVHEMQNDVHHNTVVDSTADYHDRDSILFRQHEEMVYKVRITPTGVTEGERGFEQTKRCYLTEVIPFFKTLKEHFAGVQTALFKEVKVMEEIFDQMNDEVDQNTVWICQKSQEISQKRTRERMSDQEAKEIKAEAREIMPQPSTVNCS